MKTKKEILDIVSTDLVMKSKTISHIILEGTDGVGKTTMLINLLQHYNYRYVVYDRGELSNMFYARKYDRPFVSLQRNLPFLHVLLTCDKKELKQRIIARQKMVGQNNYDTIDDFRKIKDQDYLIALANEMKNDFHIIIVDITGLSQEESCKKVAKAIDEYVDAMPVDENETQWNVMYRKACDKYGYKFEVRNNQPYINGKMFMSESTWQNGAYETFTDKSCPDNLLFSAAYSEKFRDESFKPEKLYDFSYVINSKINRRHEIIDYYLEMLKHNKTCIVSEKIHAAFEEKNFIKMPRVFGDDFILENAKAKATVYCARDLEYLKLQTARLYEAILARQVVFVDKESDKNQDMLYSIFYANPEIVNLLTVTPETFIASYNKVFRNPDLVDFILKTQLEWYNKQVSKYLETHEYDIDELIEENTEEE